MRLATLFLFAAAVPLPGQAPIRGDYIEGRSNHVYGCYCEWSGESVTAGKEAIVAWGFRSGEWDGVPLAGLRAAAAIVGEATLSQGAGKRRSVLFLDQRTPKAQQQAGERFLRTRYAGLLGDVSSVQSTAIDFERTAHQASLRVGEMMNLVMRRAKLPEDALQGALLWYDPFIPMAESTLGTTLSSRYWGSEFGKKWDRQEPAVTGYYGRFETPATTPTAAAASAR